MIMSSLDGLTYGNLILTGWLSLPPWIPGANMVAIDLKWSQIEQVSVILTADYFPVGMPFVRESWRNDIPWKVPSGTSIMIPRAEAAGLSTIFGGPSIQGFQIKSAIAGGDVILSGVDYFSPNSRSVPMVLSAIAGTPTFSVAHGTNPTITITSPGFNSLLTGTPGTPSASAFTVYDGGPTPSPQMKVKPMPISSVTVNATMISLGLVGTINLGDIVTLTYIPPAYAQSNSTPIQDTAGNLFPLVAAQQVFVS